MLGFMPQAEAVKQVAAADFLLLTMTNEISLPGEAVRVPGPRETDPGVEAAKNSEVSRIIARTRTGVSADPGNPAEIRAMLTRIATGSTAEFQPAWDVIREFERPRLVASYASRIRDLF